MKGTGVRLDPREGFGKLYFEKQQLLDSVFFGAKFTQLTDERPARMGPAQGWTDPIPPIVFLIGQSIELSLKAFLRAPAPAYRKHEFDYRHPDGAKIDGFPVIGRFGKAEIVE